MVRHAVRFPALAAAAVGLLATGLRAQHPSELSARDKSEVFIQHVVKFMDLEPSRYQSLVLEYELGTALAEVTSVDVGDLGLNFIHSALVELHPAYAEAVAHVDAQRDAEARKALEPFLDHRDPYLSANARLLTAELDYRAGDYGAAVRRCEKIIGDERVRVINDWRACELAALSYEKQEKALLALAQYTILLVDYVDVPTEAQSRVKARLAELDGEVGQPLHTVSTWMNQVEKLLSSEVTADDPTQEQERTIVTALDKLIELQEAIERNTCSSCGGNCKGGCKNGKPKGSRSQNPAKVSALPPPGEGEKRLRGVSSGQAGSIWGQLRMRDASRALQSFRGKLPARYEKLLEQYYKELSRQGGDGNR